VYESFYHLREKPFALTPDPDFIFRASPHRRALALLEYSVVMRTPFCLITGEAGSGKTTLVRYFLERIREPCVVGLISNAGQRFGWLLRSVCVSFDLDHAGMDKAELHQLFRRFLLAQHARDRKVVLIVDDAQNLGRTQLEELRMLSNFNDKGMLLQIILVGQPELREDIRSPEMLQLAQRIGGECNIRPLSALETRRYIYHRLRVAGGRLNTFTTTAILYIHKASGGIPRLINHYCDMALLCGCADRLEYINTSFILQVIEDQRGRRLLAR
jgi:general secretion pathway protein A